MLLQRLSEASGVSGAEAQVREILVEALRSHVDELRADTMGNLFAIKRPPQTISGERVPRVMLVTHMDEIGLMITRIERSGVLRFGLVGGVDHRILPGRRVEVGPQRVPGVIGCKPIHLVKPNEAEKVFDLEQLFIDIGATSADNAESSVKVGDTAVFATRFGPLGSPVDRSDSNSSRLVKGKAFDDRAGCTVLAEVLQGNYPVELIGVFSVQEEVGLRGARVAAYTVEPDLAIVIEGTICDDLPKDKDVSPVTRLGYGPAITIADRSFIAHPDLTRLIIDVAAQEGIPYQIKEPGLGGTDAGAIHLTRAGIPSAALAVPCRYIHGPVSVLNLDDLAHTVSLVKATLQRLQTWP